MQIEWAIYGERSGGHALLGTSGNQAFASKVTQYTDRPGTPPLGVEWGPVTSGFYYGDHYVILRTLPDVHAGRAGMVRSYAAFVPKVDLGTIDSVQSIFNLLPTGLTVVTGKLSSLEMQQGPTEQLIPADAAEPIQQTVHQLCSTGAQLPVVWSFPTDYLPLIDLLWRRLPLTLRPNFAFSFQFAPEHQLPVTPTVIATLPSLATRWPSNQVVKATSAFSSANAAVKWLVGDDGHANFATILDEFGVSLTRFDELELLSSLVDLYRRAPQLDFAQTRKLTRILEKCSTLSPRSRASRALVFERLCNLASDATPSEVLTLRNLKSDVLPDLIPSLTQTLGRWIVSNSNLPSSLGGLVEVLETALRDPSSWWSKPLLRWLDELCKLKSENATFALTDLVLISDELTEYLTARVPKSKGIEETLISALTRPLSEKQQAAVLNLSERHDWMALHAGILLLSLDSEDAVLKHAEFHSTSEAGFDYLGKKFGFTALVKAACRADIKRLSDYVAANLVAKIAELPADFAKTRPRCIQILLLAVRLSDRGSQLCSLIAQVLGEDDEFTEESRNLIMECVIKDISMLSEVEHLSDWVAALNLEQRELASSKLLEFLLKEWGRDRASTMAEAEGLDSILNARTIIQRLKSVATHETTTTALFHAD